MKRGHAVSLLTGISLLGALASFNEMTPNARASLLAAAATAQALLRSTVATYRDITDKTIDAVAREQASHVPASQRAPEDRGDADAPPPRITTRKSDPESPAPTGNPLWPIPLKQLSVTRERPLFSSSRRPPPPSMPAVVTPVVVRQPIKPPEPEHPALSLLGTVIGTDDQIGVFLDTDTRSVVRLRVGEAHHGWTLRLVKAREVTLVKHSEQAITLELRPLGEAAPARAVPALPPPVTNSLAGPATGIIPISREVSADEQPVRSPPAGARRR
jgi:general secretion pathway protein N